MTVEQFNDLVEQAYEEAFAFEATLALVYENAYQRQITIAAQRFRNETITAAWTPPVYEGLSDGMDDREKRRADRVRDEAAAAIAAVLAAAGVAVSSDEFMEAIAQRAQWNFEQEILRQLRKVVSESFDAGLSAQDTALAIRQQIPAVIPSSAQMLAQTELTALVNERTIAAAQKQFPQGASKTWLTVGDNRVRAAHAAAQGQTVPVDQPFSVGGASLMYPGDPTGPLRLVARCRCRLSYSNSVAASANGGTVMDTMETLTSGLTVTITESETEMACPSCGAMNDANAQVCDQCGADLESDAEDAAEPAEEPADTMPMADGPAWRALLAVEGVATEDGRMLAEGSLTWRQPPLSLMAMDDTSEGGHLGAKVAGRIDRIWRDGSEVWAEGVFNSDEFGLHIADLVSNQSLRGNSIDPAVLDYEVRNADTMDVLEGEQLLAATMAETPLLTVFKKAVILKSTVCSAPALEDATIMLASGALRLVWFQEQQQQALTASAAGMVPLHPPAAWFDNPQLKEPTPLTITDEGRVFGHAALWNSCHIGEPSGPGVCVPPPRSGMNYEVFHHGACRTAEGHDVVVGQLTLGTRHASGDLGWRETMEHYENSGLAFADVHAYEDRFGIVVAGALRPDVPATKVREAKAGALSGDWRQVIGRGLEFLAALVVNVPGFPIPRPSAHIVASASGEEEVLALVAAGMVEPAAEVEGMSRQEYLRTIRALTEEAEDFTFAISTADRKRMAKSGVALPDGSFPIPDCDYAERAIRAQGRANPGDRARVRAHIRKRVAALGCSGDIFDPYK